MQWLRYYYALGPGKRAVIFANLGQFATRGNSSNNCQFSAQYSPADQKLQCPSNFFMNKYSPLSYIILHHCIEIRSNLVIKYTAMTKEMPVFVFLYCSRGFPFLYVYVCQPVCWLFSWDLSGLRLNGRLHDCHLELVGRQWKGEDSLDPRSTSPPPPSLRSYSLCSVQLDRTF